MISHVHIGVSDVGRALSFYAPVMEILGLNLKISEEAWAAWKGSEARPLFIIGIPYDRQPMTPGNGQMVALLAPSREIVDKCHAAALSQGGTCGGPPGLRPHYHPNYYGAYFRDLDGNKLCVCCHDPLAD